MPPPDNSKETALLRIAEALERLAPPDAPKADLAAADAFVWEPDVERPRPIERVNRVPPELLRGIDGPREVLLANTRRFADGLPANNALLWGARGMGKSSLVKAVHASVAEERGDAPGLVEIHREDVDTLPQLLALGHVPIKGIPFTG